MKCTSYWKRESLPGGATQYLHVSAQWSGRTSATPPGDVTEKPRLGNNRETYGRGALAIYHNTGKNSARPDRRSAQGPGEGVTRSMCNREEHRHATHVISMNCGTSQARCPPLDGICGLAQALCSPLVGVVQGLWAASGSAQPLVEFVPACQALQWLDPEPVSYTHLTLPTKRIV